MDFTLKRYRQLLLELQQQGYTFCTYAEYVAGIDADKLIVLRHDVDKKPLHSLATAKIEAQLGIRATYYFRAVAESWDESVIRQIAALQHEVGYHYESLTTCHGNVDAAYRDFCANLKKLRALVSVKTICMHGSPRSPFDSKHIWCKYDYHDLGIVGEPYLDTNFSRLFYLTDTGRRWDGFKVSVRDRIPEHQEEWLAKGWVYSHTSAIIQAAQEKRLATRLMMTTHPQRWTDQPLSWLQELCLQNLKNIVKRILIVCRK